MRHPAGLVFLASLLGVLSCERAWDLANRDSLRRDLTALCAAHGVKVEPCGCHMVGQTRDGVCHVRLDMGQIEWLATRIGLVRVDTLPEGPRAELAARVAARCGGEGTRWTYAAFGRPASLRLPSGRAFEYLVVTVWAETGEACLSVGYAFG